MRPKINPPGTKLKTQVKSQKQNNRNQYNYIHPCTQYRKPKRTQIPKFTIHHINQNIKNIDKAEARVKLQENRMFSLFFLGADTKQIRCELVVVVVVVVYYPV
eukprot:TRINITY_DN5328_c0_g1_i1.p1 TRINITY_DN5328_c0_g1~~TRINITY_DN5328_c0_g1_i1.p1  ORF type:complete len:103 (-),score=1.21 TRINITY_DN5328_c0_g1_i1:403-711(-)